EELPPIPGQSLDPCAPAIGRGYGKLGWLAAARTLEGRCRLRRPLRAARLRRRPEHQPAAPRRRHQVPLRPFLSRPPLRPVVYRDRWCVAEIDGPGREVSADEFAETQAVGGR